MHAGETMHCTPCYKCAQHPWIWRLYSIKILDLNWKTVLLDHSSFTNRMVYQMSCLITHITCKTVQRKIVWLKKLTNDWISKGCSLGFCFWQPLCWSSAIEISQHTRIINTGNSAGRKRHQHKKQTPYWPLHSHGPTISLQSHWTAQVNLHDPVCHRLLTQCFGGWFVLLKWVYLYR